MNHSSEKHKHTMDKRDAPCSPAREFPFSDDDFMTLSDLITRQTGIVLKTHKKNMVYSRLARRLRALGLNSFTDYLLYLSSARGETEIGSLINAITTNLTRFFREPHHFEHLEHIVIPDVIRAIREGRQARIRIWSAGCSSGEEPYCIAMVLDKLLRKYGLTDIDAKILATDLDSNMLKIGRQGMYKSASVVNIDPSFEQYIEQAPLDEDKVHISDHLRRYISFKQLNLMHDWPMNGPFDAIFCRNVMIYFDGETKTKLTQRFVRMLQSNGWLFVGHSETILGADKDLLLYGRTIYQRNS